MTRTTLIAVLGAAVVYAGTAPGFSNDAAASPRQSLDDAWWTGPLLAASASTLPQGHILVEPYVFDVVTYGHFAENGARHSVLRESHVGSLTYLLYGMTDTVSVGLLPRFSLVRPEQGSYSTGVRVGDLGVQGQYRLMKFKEGTRHPTISVVLAETLPTGRYDNLGDRPEEGVGSGVYTTTLSLYSQYYFWVHNGRILRARLNVSKSWSSHATIENASSYGTSTGFRGAANPGSEFLIVAAAEYSVTRSWVMAMDVLFDHQDNTRVSGTNIHMPWSAAIQVADTGSSQSFGLAPAIEYNWSGNLGIIIGVRVIAAGRNAAATVTPAVAINIVH